MVIIGIDLGTTFSCVAYFKNEKLEIIENKNTGNRLTQSVVTFTDSGIKVGKTNIITDCCIYETKRIIGRDFNDEEVQNDVQSC